MASRWNYLFVFILSLVISGCFGRYHHDDDDSSEDDDHYGDDYRGEGWNWQGTAGIGVTIAIIFAVCGIISLISWLSCTIYSRLRKDRVGVIKVGARGSAPPAWSANLIFQPEMAVGFGAVSDGFLRMGPSHLVRNRAGTSHTDGAKWAVGMTKGKHVFEVTWSWGHRGHHAGVGVGIEGAPLMAKGIGPLVGSDPTTWGLDIVKRRALHNKRIIKTCPTDGSYVPDKFLMYVDMDEGTLGYGNDVTYWGEVITDLPKQGTQTLYVMVGASHFQSEICVNYKGSAPDGAEEKAGGRPHYHLPPLYPTTSQAPPTYVEFQENKPLPVMVMPPRPFGEVMYEAPPPYSRPPTGMEPEKG